MPTVRDLKIFIRNNRPVGCRPYSRLNKEQLRILALELGFGQAPTLPTTQPPKRITPKMPTSKPPSSSPFEDVKQKEIKTQEMPYYRNYVEWDDILKIPSSRFDKNPVHKMLYALYTKIPPRWWEYMNIMVIDNDADTLKSLKLNWNTENFITMYSEMKNNYIILHNGEPQFMVLNNFKTVKKYGSYVLRFSDHPDLKKIIQDNYDNSFYEGFLLEPGSGVVGNDDVLYKPNNKNNEDYEIMIEDTFQVGNKRPNLSLLRLAYIKWTRKQNFSVAKLKDIAYQMSHSFTQAEVLANRKIEFPPTTGINDAHMFRTYDMTGRSQKEQLKKQPKQITTPVKKQPKKQPKPITTPDKKQSKPITEKDKLELIKLKEEIARNNLKIEQLKISDDEKDDLKIQAAIERKAKRNKTKDEVMMTTDKGDLKQFLNKMILIKEKFEKEYKQVINKLLKPIQGKKTNDHKEKVEKVRVEFNNNFLKKVHPLVKKIQNEIKKINTLDFSNEQLLNPIIEIENRQYNRVKRALRR